MYVTSQQERNIRTSRQAYGYTSTSTGSLVYIIMNTKTQHSKPYYITRSVVRVIVWASIIGLPFFIAGYLLP